jgi:hypothetical protein
LLEESDVLQARRIVSQDGVVTCTNNAKRLAITGPREDAQGIGAQQPEGTGLQEVVPQVLEVDRGSVMAVRRQEGH